MELVGRTWMTLWMFLFSILPTSHGDMALAVEVENSNLWQWGPPWLR
jgi:hypothetical protein